MYGTNRAFDEAEIFAPTSVNCLSTQSIMAPVQAMIDKFVHASCAQLLWAIETSD